MTPEETVEFVRQLDDDQLHNLAEVVRQIQIERAIDAGDFDAIIASAFETGFGRDGLGVLPWVEGNLIVCPGGMVAKSKTNHRCRFVSVDDVWIWDSGLLLREDKRSSVASFQPQPVPEDERVGLSWQRNQPEERFARGSFNLFTSDDAVQFLPRGKAVADRDDGVLSVVASK